MINSKARELNDMFRYDKMTMNQKSNKFSNQKTQITLIIISVICVFFNYLLIVIAKNNTDLIESFYSRGFYKYFSHLLNSISNLFPFSVGEILIAILALYIGMQLILAITSLIKANVSKSVTHMLIIITLLAVTLLYYQVSWGINNYRQTIETLFDLEESEITIEDLRESYQYLIIETNQFKSEIDQNLDEISLNMIYASAYEGYEKLNEKYPFISAAKVRVKPLLISPIFSSSGYTGIYLPFLSEANINNMPNANSLAFIASHEIAHQKGFASEDEANFIGFLACYYHDDVRFKYSAHMSLMIYVGNSLYDNDKDSYEELSKLRSDGVNRDLELRRRFWDKHIKESSAKVHNDVNDVFLKANNQPDGIINYSKVTELFIKLYKGGFFNEE